MKCQACEDQATSHVTEFVAGKPVEYPFVTHFQHLDVLKPARMYVMWQRMPCR